MIYMHKSKVLITGAGHGIGRDCALALAGRGHEVFATTRTDQQAEELEQEIKDTEHSIRVGRLDVRDPSDYQKAVDFAPDALINNAGIGESGLLAEIPMERLRGNFETNVFGTIELTQKVLEGMIERGNGRVIMLSSIGGKLAIPYLGAYSMTKFALESATDALRQELAHHGIAVSAIEPAAIGTGFNERMNATKYEWFDETYRLYDDVERIQKYEAMLIRNQHQSSSITKAVLHAAESKKPKTRYIRPRQYAILMRISGIIPDRSRDWILRKMARL